MSAAFFANASANTRFFLLSASSACWMYRLAKSYCVLASVFNRPKSTRLRSVLARASVDANGSLELGFVRRRRHLKRRRLGRLLDRLRRIDGRRVLLRRLGFDVGFRFRSRRRRTSRRRAPRRFLRQRYWLRRFHVHRFHVARRRRGHLERRIGHGLRLRMRAPDESQSANRQATPESSTRTGARQTPAASPARVFVGRSLHVVHRTRLAAAARGTSFPTQASTAPRCRRRASARCDTPSTIRCRSPFPSS